MTLITEEAGIYFSWILPLNGSNVYFLSTLKGDSVTTAEFGKETLIHMMGLPLEERDNKKGLGKYGKV